MRAGAILLVITAILQCSAAFVPLQPPRPPRCLPTSALSTHPSSGIEVARGPGGDRASNDERVANALVAFGEVIKREARCEVGQDFRNCLDDSLYQLRHDIQREMDALRSDVRALKSHLRSLRLVVIVLGLVVVGLHAPDSLARAVVKRLVGR